MLNYLNSLGFFQYPEQSGRRLKLRILWSLFANLSCTLESIISKFLSMDLEQGYLKASHYLSQVSFCFSIFVSLVQGCLKVMYHLGLSFTFKVSQYLRFFSASLTQGSLAQSQSDIKFSSCLPLFSQSIVYMHFLSLKEWRLANTLLTPPPSFCCTFNSITLTPKRAVFPKFEITANLITSNVLKENVISNFFSQPATDCQFDRYWPSGSNLPSLYFILFYLPYSVL